MTTSPNFASAARAFDAASGPLVFVQHLTNEDTYVRQTSNGNILIAVPGMWATMPGNLLNAHRAPPQANATGCCPACDGVVDFVRGGLAHENWCASTDDNIAPMLEAWGRQVGRYARGRRLREDPA